jgi:diketogulonate reductase-like aldo/keto reductase
MKEPDAMSILVKDKIYLANGIPMPVMGLGVFKVDPTTTAETVNIGLQAGIRMIDTATAYANEEGVARGVEMSGIQRSELFISTKVRNADHGYDKTICACKLSLELLQTEYIDLYLIHWPMPTIGKYTETYQALEALYAQGLVRAIGVSNFNIDHLEQVMSVCKTVPMVNQIELHPYLTQNNLIEFCRQNRIAVEAWSPLAKGQALQDDTLMQIALKYGVNTAQVILRWHFQKGVVTIPKSIHVERIISNAKIFDFELSTEDMVRIEALNQNRRTGPDPSIFANL